MTRTTTRSGWLLCLSACALGPVPDDTAIPCPVPEPGSVAVVYGEAACDALYPNGGAASSTDIVLANAWMTAVLHHPAWSQTVVGVGGGTLIDAAPAGWNDRLHEAVPLVDGAWLQVEDWELLDDGIRLEGALVPLPGMPDVDTGADAEVSWHLSADGPWLELEGANGLWLHATGGAELEPVGVLRQGRQVIGHDGSVVEDLGGALVLSDVQRLVIGDAQDAWAALHEESGQPLSGTLSSGDELWVYDGNDSWLGTLELEGEDFDTWVPADAAWVRGAGGDLGLGEPTAIGTGLTLSAGGAGSVTMVPDWGETPARPLWVNWEDQGGRHGQGLLSAEGGTLTGGAGTFTLTFDGGPTVSVAPVTVEVADGEKAEVTPAVQVHFEPAETAVLATLELEGSQSRSLRVTDGNAFGRAAGQGVGFAVVAPPDVVADTSLGESLSPFLLRQDGSRLDGEDFSITTWPRSATSRQPGGGASDPRNHTDPDQALDAALGQQSGTRHSLVDVGWLTVAPEPYAVSPQPDLVRLPAPGTSGPTSGAWDDWFRWLDAAADLIPVGPYAWVTVPDGSLYGEAEVERGLLTGQVIATSGPWLALDADGAGPGEVVEASEVSVSVRDHSDGVDRVGLIADGALLLTGQVKDGVLDTTLPLPDDARWVVVAAWSTTETDHWAVSAPLWLDIP